MKGQVIGAGLQRVDGRSKVMGAARYTAEFNQAHQAHAVIVGAAIGLGRIARIDSEPTMKLPGVLTVITHRSAPRLSYKPHKSIVDPEFGERLHVLQTDEIRFFGQPIAVVVAETLDHAERAAAALRIEYFERKPLVDSQDPRAVAIIPDIGREPGILQADRGRGGADGALATARVSVQATYEIARENHNTIEPTRDHRLMGGQQINVVEQEPICGE